MRCPPARTLLHIVNAPVFLPSPQGEGSGERSYSVIANLKSEAIQSDLLSTIFGLLRFARNNEMRRLGRPVLMIMILSVVASDFY
jgi:hypothetical protein